MQLEFFLQAAGDIVEHAGENQLADFRGDEIEHDDVVADAVENFRPCQTVFEVIADGAAHPLFHHCVRVVGAHVLLSAAMFVLDINAEVGGEDEDGFGEPGGVAATVGEAAVFENLQEFVENARVGFFDFIKQHDGKRFFADGIGQFAAGVETDVTGRCAEQAGAGVFLGKLAHVEADVGALIAKNQFGQGFRQFRLAHPGRAGEEQHAPWPAAAATGLGAGEVHHRTFENVERLHHRLRLALDPLLDETAGVADALAQVILAPRIVERADLVAAYGIVDGGQAKLLVVGEFGDVGQSAQAHALGAVGKALDELRAGGFAGLGVAGKERRQLAGSGLTGFVIGTADGEAGDPFAVERQPGGQVLRPVEQPQHGVEQGFAVAGGGAAGRIFRRARHDGRGSQRKLFSGDEEALFAFAQMIGLPGEARGKVDHQGTAGFPRAADGLHQFAQAFQADDLAAAGELQVKQALGQFAAGSVVGIDTHAVAGVIHQQAAEILALQLLPQGTQQRHQGRAAGQWHEETVADVAGDDELRADRQEPLQIEQPAGERGIHPGVLRGRREEGRESGQNSLLPCPMVSVSGQEVCVADGFPAVRQIAAAGCAPPVAPAVRRH